VHGANRLGTNSLLDLLVFGKSAGESMVNDLKAATGKAHKPLPARNAADYSLSRLERLNTQTGGAAVHEPRGWPCSAPCRRTAACSASRTCWKKVSSKIAEIAEQAVASTEIKDKSQVFNTAASEALELDNLIEVAKATMISAKARKESRGAHVRDDAPDTAGVPEWPRRRQLAQAHALVQGGNRSTTSR
jgi:succinate dehydrogenase / fumarate reductase flavoprotein subunit